MIKLFRYALATLGPVGQAGAQFLFQLILLHGLDAKLFGSFSFLMVTLQLATSVWSALFCAPLLVLLNSGRPEVEAQSVRGIFAVNLLAIGAVALAFAAGGWMLALPIGNALLFAVAGAATLLRWFARSHAFAIGRPARAIVSDLLYATVLTIGTVGLLWRRAPSLDIGFAILAGAATIALAPFGPAFLRAQFADFARHGLRGYASVWKRYSGWSLIGVVSTEATMNSQAYLVTAFAGPTAFAPIAATSLLIRPVTVATNALSDYERARMARLIGEGAVDAARDATRLFRAALFLIWAVTALAVAALLEWAPHLLFPSRYALPVLAIGTGSWVAVALVRLLRAPESALLQAAGAFRPLAWASCGSALLSVGAVGLVLLVADPVWSIASIVVGELAFAIWIWRAAREWYHSETTTATLVPT